MLKKEVSIIIPVFNESGSIQILFDEILKNVAIFDQYELIFVNDGSTDNTLSILNKLMKSQTKVKMINHNKNLDSYLKKHRECITDTMHNKNQAKHTCFALQNPA